MFFGILNGAVFDWPWSTIHFGSGLALGIACGFFLRDRRRRSTLIFGVGLLVLWELTEIGLRTLAADAPGFTARIKPYVPAPFFGPFAAHESWSNIIGDLTAGSVGLLASFFSVTRRRPRP